MKKWLAALVAVGALAVFAGDAGATWRGGYRTGYYYGPRPIVYTSPSYYYPTTTYYTPATSYYYSPPVSYYPSVTYYPRTSYYYPVAPRYYPGTFRGW